MLDTTSLPTGWQDYVYAAGECIFLINTLFLYSSKKTRIPRISSITTALLLTIYALTGLTLNLHWYPYVSFILAGMWLLMASQRATQPLADDLRDLKAHFHGGIKKL